MQSDVFALQMIVHGLGLVAFFWYTCRLAHWALVWVRAYF